MSTFVGLKSVPSMDPFPKDYWGRRACAVISSYNGPAAEGEKLMTRLLDAVPPPIFNWMGAMPYPAMQALFDPFFPKGLQWYWEGDFVKTLSDEAIDTHIAHAAQAPSELCLTHLYPINGAVHRVAADATPWPVRDATFSMVIAGIDRDPQNAGALKAWGRGYWRAVHPFNMDGGYVNFMMDDEAAGRLAASYGDNYPASPRSSGSTIRRTSSASTRTSRRLPCNTRRPRRPSTSSVPARLAHFVLLPGSSPPGEAPADGGCGCRRIGWVATVP